MPTVGAIIAMSVVYVILLAISGFFVSKWVETLKGDPEEQDNKSTPKEHIWEKYRVAFLHHIVNNCFVYKNIGISGIESPMWIQYRGLEEDKKGARLIFTNSQQEEITFSIEVADEDVVYFDNALYHEIFSYFREIKYDFIKEKYPSIYQETAPVEN